jgi:pimeloyl-ACP methyl ester carboxylesterase
MKTEAGPCVAERQGFLVCPGGETLYAASHLPSAATRCPVLVLPPLLEERGASWRYLALLARALAGVGHPVLRFDYRGCGESPVTQAALRWRHLSEDALLAERWVISEWGQRPIWLGLRAGATVVLETALAGGLAAPAVALAPIARGQTMVKHWKLRARIRAELGAGETAPALATPGQLEMDGYTLSTALLDDLAEVDLLKPGPPAPVALFVLQLSHREDLSPESERLRERLGPSAQGAALKMPPWWERVDDADLTPLYSVLLDFLAAREAPTHAAN